LVDTISGEAKPIVWVGRRRADCRKHPDPRKIWPVRILSDAFGARRPARELVLSPDHAVLFDSVLIPIKYLINNTTIIQEQTSEVDYFHIELQLHDVVWAEGLPTETYLDAGDRAKFENGGFLLTLHPDFATRIWEAEGFAPLCLMGPEVDAARRLLRTREGVLAQNSWSTAFIRSARMTLK
jgi:hypothetical protein